MSGRDPHVGEARREHRHDPHRPLDLCASSPRSLVVALLWLGLDRGAHRLVPVSNRRARPRSWRSGWTRLRAKNGKAVLQYRWVPYARISTQLKRAMIAAEDARFTEHGGFDWDGIRNAIEKNRKAGEIVGGGSTITQQLAKNLFLSPARSYWRKAEEAVVTVLLEAMLPKQRIFELYLNVIEWGNGVFGAEAAAQRYFGIERGATLRRRRRHGSRR